MRKEKRFSWPKIGENASYIGGDMFTDEDQATNYIVIQDIDIAYEGKTIRVLIQNRLKTSYNIYTSTVEGGKCEFLLTGSDLSNEVFIFSARIIDGNQIASTCTMSYKVCLVGIKGNGILPEEQVNSIEELLKKLDDAIIVANAKVLELTTEGDKQVLRVNEAGDLNVNLIHESAMIVGNAISEFATASITNIIDEGTKQTNLVSGKGNEIITVADKKIADINAIPPDKNINVRNNTEYSTWLGPAAGFDAVAKVRGTMYLGFNENTGVLSKTWFKPKI